MNLLELKEKIDKAIKVFNSIDIDISDVRIIFDFNFEYSKNHQFYHNISKITYDFLDKENILKLQLE